MFLGCVKIFFKVFLNVDLLLIVVFVVSLFNYSTSFRFVVVFASAFDICCIKFVGIFV